MSNKACDAGRRDFLKAAAAVVTLAPGVTLMSIPAAAAPRPADQPASATQRWGLLVDTTRCTTDCTACVSACRTENGISGHGRPATDPQWIRKIELRNETTGATHSLPMMCQHCANPPCVDVCPTGASFKRADGIVLVDRHTCIGCRYCMMACPYKARSFVHEDVEDQRPDVPRGVGTVEGCNLCVARVDAGGLPACVESCRSNGNGAMLFGDLNDPKSEIAQRVKTYATTQLRADLGLDTGVRYQGI
ncbi:MAG: 4Fe-4S dicluster domain-containing protein [Rhodospirillales bacterium]|nr:4Fe-4S dicluster domain-containing protein [Rhodospirillales bacterium]